MMKEYLAKIQKIAKDVTGPSGLQFDNEWLQGQMEVRYDKDENELDNFISFLEDTALSLLYYIEDNMDSCTDAMSALVILNRFHLDEKGYYYDYYNIMALLKQIMDEKSSFSTTAQKELLLSFMQNAVIELHNFSDIHSICDELECIDNLLYSIFEVDLAFSKENIAAINNIIHCNGFDFEINTTSHEGQLPELCFSIDLDRDNLFKYTPKGKCESCNVFQPVWDASMYDEHQEITLEDAMREYFDEDFNEVRDALNRNFQKRDILVLNCKKYEKSYVVEVNHHGGNEMFVSNDNIVILVD